VSSDLGATSQALPQGSALRIIAKSTQSSPITVQAVQPNLPSLDERLLAAAIYAHNVHASESELAAALAPEPQPVPRQTEAADFAQLLQQCQGAALVANPPATAPIRIKLSIGPTPNYASDSEISSRPANFPAADLSSVAAGSITRDSAAPHAPNRFVEPEPAWMSEAPLPPASMPVTVGPAVDWAEALANAVHRSPAAEANTLATKDEPAAVANEPAVGETVAVLAPQQESLAANIPITTPFEPIPAESGNVNSGIPSLDVVAAPIDATKQAAIDVRSPVVANEPAATTQTAIISSNNSESSQSTTFASETQDLVVEVTTPIVANSPNVAVSSPPAAAAPPTPDTTPATMPSLSTIASSNLPDTAAEPHAATSAPEVQTNSRVKVTATPAVTVGQPSIAMSRFVASSRKSQEEPAGPTVATDDSAGVAAQPTLAAQQHVTDWRAADFVVPQPAVAPSEVRITETGSPLLNLYAMAQTQSADQHQQATAEANVLPPMTTTYSPELEAMGIPPTPLPLTNSNFLPANPENYCYRCGVQCPGGCNPGGPGWDASRPIPWEVFAQGEYIGPARLAHVPIYRLRVDDRLSFVYRLSGQVAGTPYRLNVRDRILVQSLSAPEVVNRELIVQPDGTITLPLIGQIRAAGATLDELSKHLDEELKTQIKDPRITVTPLAMNSNLEELRSSVDRRYGQGGQVSDARVSPDGTVQLPAIGLVPAQGMTLDELEREVKARYARIVEGLEVTPILLERAPRYIFVVGEVKAPGRYAMEGPTTLMQAISMAGSWNVGAQLNHVVVFRRDENWQLMATRLNVRTSLLFKKPCPSGEIWLRDSDIVLIPKSPILCADDLIDLVFTRGIYGVFPMTTQLNFTKLSSL